MKRLITRLKGIDKGELLFYIIIKVIFLLFLICMIIFTKYIWFGYNEVDINIFITIFIFLIISYVFVLTLE